MSRLIEILPNAFTIQIQLIECDVKLIGFFLIVFVLKELREREQFVGISSVFDVLCCNLGTFIRFDPLAPLRKIKKQIIAKLLEISNLRLGYINVPFEIFCRDIRIVYVIIRENFPISLRMRYLYIQIKLILRVGLLLGVFIRQLNSASLNSLVGRIVRTNSIAGGLNFITDPHLIVPRCGIIVRQHRRVNLVSNRPPAFEHFTRVCFQFPH